ncbi:hypothetical protein D3C75_693640 [compost metagenome]
MRHLLPIQQPENILLLPDFMLPVIGIAIGAIPGFNDPHLRIKLPDPAGPDMQRHRHHLRIVDDHNQLIHLLQGGFKHILMPLMQGRELSQCQAQCFHCSAASFAPLFHV